MKKLLFTTILLWSIQVGFAQGVLFLDQNSIQIPRVSTNPGCTVADKGKITFNTTQNKLLYCDGTTWIDPATGGTPNNWVNSGNDSYLQSTTGRVGIGTTTPNVKLDVLHSGGVGILSKSSSSWSAIDIDAADGDAALRFRKSGVFQWNIKNRPSDNYFEIFENGVNQSRFVIEKGSGNVGIGETSNPAYKLDVFHGGGSTGGIRNRSSSSYCLLDIDAFSGDAAIRLAKNGVYQWNIRNHPDNDNFQIIEMGVNGTERFRIENTTGKVVISGAAQVVGTLSKGGGSFKIDHPLDPENKYLYHSFVESPDMMNIYNGNVTTDALGKATVDLPDYFQALNMEYRYQLTPIGTFAQAMVSKKVDKNRFEITTDKPNVEVSWQVTGVRNDAFAQKNRIPTIELKTEEEKGKYLHPTAFGKSESMSIGHKNARVANEPSSLDNAPVQSKKVVEGNQNIDKN